MTDSIKLMLRFLLCAAWIGGLGACAAQSSETQDQLESDMKLSSSAFEEGGFIPPQYSYSLGRQCSGENLSPPLAWSNAPVGTRSFALTVIDTDARNWVHWLVFNIPADVANLEEHPAGPEVGISGKNGFGELGWSGPCPPSGTHHYVFTLYALDTSLELSAGASLKDVQAAMEKHILAKASLTGLSSKK